MDSSNDVLRNLAKNILDVVESEERSYAENINLKVEINDLKNLVEKLRRKKAEQIKILQEKIKELEKEAD